MAGPPGRPRGLLDGDAFTPAGEALRAGIEEATDRGQRDLVAALDDDAVRRLEDLLAPWGAAVVAGGGSRSTRSCSTGPEDQEESVHGLPVEDARALAEQRLSRLGAPPEQVRDAVEVCLDAELRGRTSHGLRLLRNVCDEYENGADRRTAPRWVHDTPVSGLLDGGFALSVHGHVVAVRAAVAKARDVGIALCGVRNAGVSGALGYYVRVPAEQGFFAVAPNTTPLGVVAPGTATALLGTNPLAIGVPQRDGPPVVLDMATSAVAFDRVLMARAAGTALPPGSAVDADGQGPSTPPRPSTPPAAAGCCRSAATAATAWHS